MTTDAGRNNDNVLVEIKDLHTFFFLPEGIVRAVNGVDLDIQRGQTLGVVGESGCGKSMTALSLMQLVPYPGRITDGEILYYRTTRSNGGGEAADIVRINDLEPNSKEMRGIRGAQISMVFQEPMTAMSPVRTVGVQITEAIELHQWVSRSEARDIAVELLRRVRLPHPERIGTAVFSLGIAKAAFKLAVDYAKQREAFGKPIGSFQILQHYLADIAIEIENARNLIYKCAWLHDHGQRYDVEAAMAKVVACKASELAALHGMEILGGYGFTMEYDMQRHFRDYKQMMFSPISDEMSKNYIAQSFGLPKSY